LKNPNFELRSPFSFLPEPLLFSTRRVFHPLCEGTELIPPADRGRSTEEETSFSSWFFLRSDERFFSATPRGGQMPGVYFSTNPSPPHRLSFPKFFFVPAHPGLFLLRASATSMGVIFPSNHFVLPPYLRNMLPSFPCQIFFLNV